MPSQLRVAYLIKRFPHLSETFILHEVLELERKGLRLRIYSLHMPTGKVNQSAKAVRSPIDYLPESRCRRSVSLLEAALRRLLMDPGTFLGVTVRALIRFHHPSTPRHILYAAFVANRLERDGITHLHAHYANAPTTVALLAHQLTGIPYSFTAHAKDIYLSRKRTLTYKIENAAFVVTCSQYNRRYLASLARPGHAAPIHCVYHGLDRSAFPSPDLNRSQLERPLILSVARLVEKKGLTYLLAACRRLMDQGYEFECRIVGEGPFRRVLQEQVRELGLTERVDLWGAETHERVLEMYPQATLVALPCVVARNGDRDGIPNALVEALYMCVPVVSTPVSGVPELIRSEVNGLLVPERDSHMLAASIARLLEDPGLRRRLGLAGRRTVLSQFDMATNVRRLRQLLGDIRLEASISSVEGDQAPGGLPSALRPTRSRSAEIDLPLPALGLVIPSERQPVERQG